MASKKSSKKASSKRDPDLLKVSELDFPAPVLKKATARVRSLTVRDLNDLAGTFLGHETYNPRVKALTPEDLSSLEDVFRGQRDRALKLAESVESLADAEGWSVSCCSCTPCCCCAAADVDPFA
jgi:hypothetical protein